jgi:hypothetical protein
LSNTGETANNHYSKAFDIFVESKRSTPEFIIVGLIAYALYKDNKRSWTIQQKKDKKRELTKQEKVDYESALLLPDSVKRFEDQAQTALMEVVSVVLRAQEENRSRSEVAGKVSDLDNTLQSLVTQSSFWRAVRINIVSSFLFSLLVVVVFIVSQHLGGGWLWALVQSWLAGPGGN